eukprot:474935_1
MQALQLCRSKCYRIKALPRVCHQRIIYRNMTLFSSPKRYSKSLSIVHWCMAGGILSCIGLVEVKKRRPKGDPYIKPLMNYHKSIGMLMFGFIAVRIGLRGISKIPKPINGPKWMIYGGHASHIGLYSMMIFMPVTGFVMGFYGPRKIPFFGLTIPGAKESNKVVAKWCYKWHKRVGTAMEILVGLHVCGAAMHVVKGDQIFSRISPFAGTAVIAMVGEDGDIDDDDYDLFIDVKSTNRKTSKEDKQ